MKLFIKALLVALFIWLIPYVGTAQSNREDVVYLKNGKVYRGVIIEEVLNEKITIQVNSGTRYIITMDEIAKIAKEKIVTDTLAYNSQEEPRIVVRKKRPPFYYKVHQPFFQGELSIGVFDIGMRFTAGYKFEQFGILGAGIGANAFNTDIVGNDEFTGWYFPLYLHYSGDILRKRVTPFYTLEAGYDFRYSTHSYLTVTGLGHPKYTDRGGAMGSVAFGVKLYSRHKVYATWALHLDMRQAQNRYTNHDYNSTGQYVSVSYNSMRLIFIPGISIAVGF